MIGRRGLVLGAIAILALAACDSSGASSNKGTIKIGVDLPTSGGDASVGVPTLNGVKFAVSQAGSIKGFSLEVAAKDDTVNGVHDPQKGAQNVRDLISDSKVLAMVGAFNSNVTRAEMPITNQANLTQISPANTNQCLTKPIYLPTSLGVPKDVSCKDAGLPSPSDLRPNGTNNYFRVATTDDLQGPAMADYAYDTLKLRNVATASDNEVYGKGIKDTFAAEFKNKGGTIATTQDFDTKTTNDFRPFFNSAKSKNADGIYFGGTSSNKVCVARSQGKDIIDVPFMGGDGIVDGQCIKDAADKGTAMYGTVATADASKIPESKAAIDAFKAAYPNKDDYGSYTMPGYDSAKIIIEAIGRAIDDAGGNMPTREQVRAQVAKTKDFKGALGQTSFDANGDTTNKAITIYHSDGTPLDWVSISVITPTIKN